MKKKENIIFSERKIDEVFIHNIDNFIKQNDIDKIFLDIDGVLFASCQAMVEVINDIYGTNFDGSMVTSWNFNNLIPTLTDEEIEALFDNLAFFEKVKFIEGAVDFLNKYRNKIIMVTKANTLNYSCKREIFDAYGFQDIPIIGLPLNVSKGLINMQGKSLFIDDNANNLKESNAFYKIMFCEYNDNQEREWQKDWNKLKMYKW